MHNVRLPMPPPTTCAVFSLETIVMSGSEPQAGSGPGQGRQARQVANYRVQVGLQCLAWRMELRRPRVLMAVRVTA